MPLLNNLNLLMKPIIHRLLFPYRGLKVREPSPLSPTLYVSTDSPLAEALDHKHQL